MSDVAADEHNEQDIHARQRALDVTTSFLVQAPAGSGKTGLLIQRYLALLAVVDRPEQVVAMTFTRKAAAEMRERVLEALQQASCPEAIPPLPHHSATTFGLAKAALLQDERHGWQLLAQPSRLRMLTIDGLATALTRQAPVASGLGALPAFVDDAANFHAQAVRAALKAAEPEHSAWRCFLGRVDNDADRAVSLLAALLARRDQWLRLPLGAPSVELRRALEQALRVESELALSRVRAMLPAAMGEHIAASASHAAAHFADIAGREPWADALASLAALGGIPDATSDALPNWRALADFLLTKGKPTFRQRISVLDGFAPAGKDPGAARRAAAIQTMKDLLADARSIPGLADALDAVRYLPPPEYSDGAWTFIDATLRLLPQVAAHLLTVWAKEGVADFGEATLRALAALGNADDPGELLLSVDYQIAHLLVDEFQDTSWTHGELIARLTSGWEEGDGRTLFAVGDPMQSIYRFREAEVGLFLEAQLNSRVAGIPVECLGLSRNFRSQEAIVDWINDVFPRVLPAVSDPARGEVAYKQVLANRVAGRDDYGGATPTLDLVADRREEAQAVVRRIREAQAAGSTEIAILVQARKHLDLILPTLRNEGIPCAAIELETLAQRLATRDLVSLTRALTQPSDRVAGLALLRAPWCGLALRDLLPVAERALRHGVLDAMADPALVPTLSEDGKLRLTRLQAALKEPMTERGRSSVTRRVRSAWLALGGPACGDGDLDAAGAQRFFALLAEHERAGDIADWDMFVAATEKLFAEPAEASRSTVQAMTLHKAKGLEFDTVIMPGLDRPTGRDDEPALRWKQREHGAGQSLLLAPLRAREGAQSEPDPVYRYLKALDATESYAERGRLLYVGCTRAKRRLHLLAAPGLKLDGSGEPPQWRTPAKSSALARLWAALSAAVPPPPASAPAGAAQAAATGDGSGEESAGSGEQEIEDVALPMSRPLRRLPSQWTLPVPAASIHVDARGDDVTAPQVAFDWAHATAAAVGTVAHRVLAQVASEGLPAWDRRDMAPLRGRIAADLAHEGVPSKERAEAVARVESAVARTLADPRGRWLFDAAHAQARSEWSLAGVDGDAVRHVTLDRTMIVEGVRWIIDFKTGRHEGGSIEAFLDREVLRYREQLERYARIVRELDSRPNPIPIRLALYFPLVEGGWREWQYSESTTLPDASAEVSGKLI